MAVDRTFSVCSDSPGCTPVGLQVAPDAAEEVKEFYRLARPEQVAGELSTRAAVDYLIDLPTEKQLIVARALIQDRDPGINFWGVSVLSEKGNFEEVVPRVISYVTGGREKFIGLLARKFAHTDDSVLSARLFSTVNRYLLANLASYSGEERHRVEKFLTTGFNFEKPERPFSRAKAESLIAYWEEQVRKYDVSRKPSPQ